MPLFFPYINTGKRILVDGGVMMNVDIKSGVRRCLEIVEHQKQIQIDVILPEGA